MSQLTAPWILSEDLAGLRAQSLGLAESAGLRADVRVLQPRPPWKWIAARLWPRPLSVVAEAVHAPLPDLVIGCGGMAAAVLAMTTPLYWFTAVRPLSDTAGVAAAIAVQALTLGANSTATLAVAAFCAPTLLPGLIPKPPNGLPGACCCAGKGLFCIPPVCELITAPV